MFYGPGNFLEIISWALPSIIVSYLRLSCSSISGEYSQSYLNFKSLKKSTFTAILKKYFLPYKRSFTTKKQKLFQENLSSAQQQSINWIRFIKWDWQYY